MLPNQGSRDHIKLFKGNHSIESCFSGQEHGEINKQRRASVVGDRNQIVQTLAGPVFFQHFFFRNQAYLTAVRLALTDELGTFEVGGHAYDVQGTEY